MANRIKINGQALARATIQSDRVREIISREATAVAQRTQAITDDRIVTYDGGISRARSYVHRLGSGAAGEARDGALQRGLGR